MRPDLGKYALATLWPVKEASASADTLTQTHAAKAIPICVMPGVSALLIIHL